MVKVVICGTPGTGKSTIVEKLKYFLKNKTFLFINVSKYALDNQLTLYYDETLDTHVLDEDKLVAKFQAILCENQDVVIESIHADLFDNEDIDHVFVCQCDNKYLYDRLKQRNYSETKLNNNVEAEIFQIIADEARQDFDEDKITVLRNNDPSDLESITKIILSKLGCNVLEDVN